MWMLCRRQQNKRISGVVVQFYIGNQDIHIGAQVNCGFQFRGACGKTDKQDILGRQQTMESTSFRDIFRRQEHTDGIPRRGFRMVRNTGLCSKINGTCIF